VLDLSALGDGERLNDCKVLSLKTLTYRGAAIGWPSSVWLGPFATADQALESLTKDSSFLCQNATYYRSSEFAIPDKRLHDDKSLTRCDVFHGRID
jgi:hypothetical protein